MILLLRLNQFISPKPTWNRDQQSFFLSLCAERYSCYGYRLVTGDLQVPQRAVAQDHRALSGKQCSDQLSDCWSHRSGRHRCGTETLELCSAASEAFVRCKYKFSFFHSQKISNILNNTKIKSCVFLLRLSNSNLDSFHL